MGELLNIRYTLLLGGRNPFFRNAIDPLHELFKPTLVDEGWEIIDGDDVDAVPALHISRQITADATVVATLVVGVIVFISSWAGEKILDRFFEKKLQKAVNNLLSKIDRGSNFSEDQVIEYQHVVWYEDIELGVVLRLRVKNSDTEKYNDALLQAHRCASSWINSQGRQAPIHAYIIEDGKCNLEPKLYQSLQHMEDEERRENRRRIVSEFKLKGRI
jgi:hypothetical protein